MFLIQILILFHLGSGDLIGFNRLGNNVRSFDRQHLVRKANEYLSPLRKNAKGNGYVAMARTVLANKNLDPQQKLEMLRLLTQDPQKLQKPANEITKKKQNRQWRRKQLHYKKFKHVF